MVIIVTLILDAVITWNNPTLNNIVDNALPCHTPYPVETCLLVVVVLLLRVYFPSSSVSVLRIFVVFPLYVRFLEFIVGLSY